MGMRQLLIAALMLTAAPGWAAWSAAGKYESIEIGSAGSSVVVNKAWLDARLAAGTVTLVDETKTSDSAGGTWFLQDNAGVNKMGIPQGGGAPYLAGDWAIGTDGAASGDRNFYVYSDTAGKYGYLRSTGGQFGMRAVGASNPVINQADSYIQNVSGAGQPMYFDLGTLLNLRDVDASNTVRSNWDSSDGCWDMGRLEIGGTEVISTARAATFTDAALTDAGAPTLTMTSTSSSASDDPKIQFAANTVAGGDQASIRLVGSEAVPTVAVSSLGAMRLRVDAAETYGSSLYLTAGGAPTTYYGALSVNAAGKVRLFGTVNGEVTIGDDSTDIIRINTTSDSVGIGTAPDTSLGYEIKTLDLWTTGGLRVDGRTVYTPTTQNLTASNQQLTITGPVLHLTADANYTLNASPVIPAGFAGQYLRVINVDTTDTITFSDSLGVLDLTGATVALGPKDSILLYYTGSQWLQIGPLVDC
jgi:hypothetical protein